MLQIDNEEDWLAGFDGDQAGYCYPQFFEGFGPDYGKLYNIHAILSACMCRPTRIGLHLETHLGMPVEALTTPDRALYEIGHDLKDDELWNGTNDTGFSVVPAGEIGYNGFASQGYSAVFLDHHPTRGVQQLRRPFLRGRRNRGPRILLRARRLFGALREGLILTNLNT